MKIDNGFKIKNIRLIGQTTCELYMENTETSCVKGWIINCNHVFVHQFHD
ncbi:hypothetical protein [Acinetobacter soli]|nr:hypothetical protein [Acinetobacter soli]